MDQPADNTVTKDPDEEARALAAVEQHHADMLRRLSALVATLSHAVQSGDAVSEHDAHEVLVEWCENDLVPHALAEEGPLYGGPRTMPQGRLLVEGMLAEHQVIVGLLEELRGATGVAAAVAAGSIRNIFALHLDKENRLLMPFIAASPELSLARAVEGLHELVGESRVHQHGDGHGHSV